MKCFVLSALVLLASTPVYAQNIYKCDGGYTDKPCGNQAVKIRKGENLAYGDVQRSDNSGAVSRLEAGGGGVSVVREQKFENYKRLDSNMRSPSYQTYGRSP